MSFSFCKNPFEKYKDYIKKSKNIETIQHITDDLGIDDWSKVQFLGLIIKKEEVIDKKNKTPKIKLLVTDQSYETNMTVTAKKFDSMNNSVEEGHIYHLEGKVCPVGKNRTRYIIVEKVIKQLDG